MLVERRGFGRGDSGLGRLRLRLSFLEVPVRPSSQKETTFRRTLREPVRMARGEDAGTPAISASAHHFLTSDLDLASAEDAQIVSTHHVTRQREAQKHAAELVPRGLTQKPRRLTFPTSDSPGQSSGQCAARRADLRWRVRTCMVVCAGGPEGALDRSTKARCGCLPARPDRPEVGASLPDQLNAVRFFWSNYAYARRVVYIT